MLRKVLQQLLHVNGGFVAAHYWLEGPRRLQLQAGSQTVQPRDLYSKPSLQWVPHLLVHMSHQGCHGEEWGHPQARPEGLQQLPDCCPQPAQSWQG